MNFGTITYQANISHSTYHSGTAHVQKRLSGGLLWDSFFTYSKSIDGTGVGNTDVASNLYKGRRVSIADSAMRVTSATIFRLARAASG